MLEKSDLPNPSSLPNKPKVDYTKSTFERLNQEADRLSKESSNLSNKYDKLENNRSQLNESNRDLQEKHVVEDTISKKIKHKEGRVSGLEKRVIQLEQEVEEAKKSYDDRKNRYTSILEEEKKAKMDWEGKKEIVQKLQDEFKKIEKLHKDVQDKRDVYTKKLKIDVGYVDLSRKIHKAIHEKRLEEETFLNDWQPKHQDWQTKQATVRELEQMVMAQPNLLSRLAMARQSADNAYSKVTEAQERVLEARAEIKDLAKRAQVIDSKKDEAGRISKAAARDTYDAEQQAKKAAARGDEIAKELPYAIKQRDDAHETFKAKSSTAENLKREVTAAQNSLESCQQALEDKHKQLTEAQESLKKEHEKRSELDQAQQKIDLAKAAEKAKEEYETLRRNIRDTRAEMSKDLETSRNNHEELKKAIRETTVEVQNIKEFIRDTNDNLSNNITDLERQKKLFSDFMNCYGETWEISLEEKPYTKNSLKKIDSKEIYKKYKQEVLIRLSSYDQVKNGLKKLEADVATINNAYMRGKSLDSRFETEVLVSVSDDINLNENMLMKLSNAQKIMKRITAYYEEKQNKLNEMKNLDQKFKKADENMRKIENTGSKEQLTYDQLDSQAKDIRKEIKEINDLIKDDLSDKPDFEIWSLLAGKDALVRELPQLGIDEKFDTDKPEKLPVESIDNSETYDNKKKEVLNYSSSYENLFIDVQGKLKQLKDNIKEFNLAREALYRVNQYGMPTVTKFSEDSKSLSSKLQNHAIRASNFKQAEEQLDLKIADIDQDLRTNYAGKTVNNSEAKNQALQLFSKKKIYMDLKKEINQIISLQRHTEEIVQQQQKIIPRLDNLKLTISSGTEELIKISDEMSQAWQKRDNIKDSIIEYKLAKEEHLSLLTSLLREAKKSPTLSKESQSMVDHRVEALRKVVKGKKRS